MSRDLKNKVVVITGGARGIGFEIADKYLENGAKIVLLDINEDQGAEAVATLSAKYGVEKVHFIKCDVTSDLDEVTKTIIDKYVNVDVLVNSAGIAVGFKVNDAVTNKKLIDVNVTALILWSMKFWQHMRTDEGGNGGTIINISSILGYRINEFAPVYQASKFAVIGFTKSLGHKYNYDRSGVRVFVICPGFTYTNMTTEDVVNNYYDEEIKDDAMKNCYSYIWQDVDAVGKAAVEIFEKAESGSTWLIEGAKPIEEILKVERIYICSCINSFTKQC